MAVPRRLCFSLSIEVFCMTPSQLFQRVMRAGDGRAQHRDLDSDSRREVRPSMLCLPSTAHCLFARAKTLARSALISSLHKLQRFQCARKGAMSLPGSKQTFTYAPSMPAFVGNAGIVMPHALLDLRVRAL